MKNKYIVLGGMLLLMTIFSSCEQDSFLDQKGADIINEQIVFADSTYTISFLNDLYGTIDFNAGPKQTSGNPIGYGSIFAEVTDEAEGRYPAGGNMDKVIGTGTFNGSFFSKMESDYEYLYGRIRHANIYLKNVELSPISNSLRTRTKAEARFLRAWYYHLLIKHFGGVPLVGDDVYDKESAGDKPGRNTFAECVEYLLNELDEIAPLLPLKNAYAGTLNNGRVTRGAVLALKSRILLHAASPLFNGGSNPVNEPNVPGSFATDPEVLELVAYPDYQQSRWDRALQAAKAVMDLNQYSLVIDNTTKPGYGFYIVFVTRLNDELIFVKHRAPGKVVETDYLPRSRGGARFYHYPTQELVDKFPMLSGKPISDPASGYNETATPYRNRDPRLAYTILYNTNEHFLNSARALAPLYTYVGAAQDGLVELSSNQATITGYYRRKGMNEGTAVTGGGQNEGATVLIRYVEILLNYAEAANEMGQTAEAMLQLKAIRERAGLVKGVGVYGYGLPDNPTKEQARLLIQNERAIELAFEEHRLWDIRRWKIGGQLLNGKPLTGIRITKVTGGNPGPNTVYRHERIPLRTRYFQPNIYFFPMPQTEIGLNRGILQNPGW